MNVLIITGGSKGIGKAIAQKYTAENFIVYSISRSKSIDDSYHQIEADLTSSTETIKTIGFIFSKIKSSSLATITLLNNAGSLGEINSLGKIDSEKIQQTIQLNTITPLILSNEFIRLTNHLKCKKQIITISSGAAINPYYGWSVYCSSKAAIEMMTKTIAQEQNEFANGVKAIAIKPGVVDTNMQTLIRNTSEKAFKNVQRFKDLKDNYELYTPEFVANKIYAIDSENLLKNGDIIDIRKF